MTFERSYTISELSEMTGVPRPTLDKAVQTGRLEAFLLPGFERGKRVSESEAKRFFGRLVQVETA